MAPDTVWQPEGAGEGKGGGEKGDGNEVKDSWSKEAAVMWGEGKEVNWEERKEAKSDGGQSKCQNKQSCKN